MSEFLLQNARSMHKAGNFAEAMRLYGEVLRLNPRQFQALYALGFLRYQAAQYGEAERLMSEAIKINPGMAEAYYIQGCCLLRASAGDQSGFDRGVGQSGCSPDGAQTLRRRGRRFREIAQAPSGSPRCARSFGILQIASLRLAALDAGPRRYCGGLERR